MNILVDEKVFQLLRDALSKNSMMLPWLAHAAAQRNGP